MTSNPTCIVAVYDFESVYVHAVVQTIRGWLELYLHQVPFKMMIQVTHVCMLIKHICALLI